MDQEEVVETVDEVGSEVESAELRTRRKLYRSLPRCRHQTLFIILSKLNSSRIRGNGVIC